MTNQLWVRGKVHNPRDKWHLRTPGYHGNGTYCQHVYHSEWVYWVEHNAYTEPPTHKQCQDCITEWAAQRLTRNL